MVSKHSALIAASQNSVINVFTPSVLAWDATCPRTANFLYPGLVFYLLNRHVSNGYHTVPEKGKLNALIFGPYSSRGEQQLTVRSLADNVFRQVGAMGL